MSSAEALRLQFQQMSASRDEPVQSETSVQGYDTSDGYVQEVVSKSPRLSRKASSEDFQTVTSRKTVTRSGGPGSTTVPSFRIGTVEVHTPRDENNFGANNANNNWEASSNASGSSGISPASPTPVNPNPAGVYYATNQTQQSRPLPPGAADNMMPPLTNNINVAGGGSGAAASTRSMSVGSVDSQGNPTRRVTGIIPAGPKASWVRQEEMYPGGNTSRSVSYGGTETRMIEPSRVSPLHDIGTYAPVKYISKRELRRRQQQQQRRSNGLETRIRSGSVPRLDREREHGSRQFAPYGGEGSPSQQYYEARPSRGRVEAEDDGYMSEYAAQQQYQRGRNMEPRSVPQYAAPPLEAPEFDEYVARPAQRRYATPSRSASGQRYGTPSRASSTGRESVYSVATTSADLNNPYSSLEDVGRMLARARNVQAPPAPAYGEAAYKLLARGTYLIKYGRGGNPHERWLTMRMVSDEETGYVGPFLLWSIHDKAVGFKEKLHLSHLVEVRPGLGSPNFQRQLTGDGITGPYVGGKRSVVIIDYAFTLIFRSYNTMRTVDVLALDDQTYRCWLLVCEYLASINRGAIDVEPADATTLAPDTPRSQSQASQI